MNKRAVAVMFFIIAAVLAIFSFSATYYVEHSVPGGQTVEQDLDGRIELAVLPQENSSISVGSK